MVFQYTHILCRIWNADLQDRVPKLTGTSGSAALGRIVGHPDRLPKVNRCLALRLAIGVSLASQLDGMPDAAICLVR